MVIFAAATPLSPELATYRGHDTIWSRDFVVSTVAGAWAMFFGLAGLPALARQRCPPGSCAVTDFGSTALTLGPGFIATAP